MPKLGVNIDHVASLRELRRGFNPDPTFAALNVQAAGADSIVIHLREDRRHIKDSDLFLLKKIVNIKLNLEMSTNTDIVKIACQVKPNQATLVPEKRQELTTEGGLDVVGNFNKVKRVADTLKKHKVEVSLFIDPDKKQIDASCKTGVKIIELHTGRYADSKDEKSRNKYFKEIESATRYALGKGLVVNAGHGLDYSNVARIARIKGIEELNIGYSIICRAVFIGLYRATREMMELIQ